METPCPRCQAAVPVPEDQDRGACPSCGQAVRFVDVPDRPCPSCGAQLVFPPGREAVRCPACGVVAAEHPARPLEARASCPRCRRRIRVPWEADHATCPRCGQAMTLADA